MKIVLTLLILLFLVGCAQPSALLGPMYTIGTTGNVLQAGASYGTSYAVKKMTGKTVPENVNAFIDTEELKEELKENPDEFFSIVKKHAKRSKEIVTITNR
jgi:hypothetical protein|tara:strand:- start:203 stop:505 length:303 start_codon:yes stop_codon:yes gene_type:complete